MSNLALNLLIELRNRRQYGDSVSSLLALLRVSGHRKLTLPELEKQLRDLADKEWIIEFDAVLGGKYWRITELGKSALEEAGI